MKIYCTVEDEFYSSTKALFAGHDVKLLPRNYRGMDDRLSMDLLIFTGGEDICPEYYGIDIPKNCIFDRSRDEFEFTVLRDIQTRKLFPTKVLGICRGSQVLGVGFGGQLVYDIYNKFGKSHPHIHSLKWKLPTKLSEFFPKVNSIHHQAVSKFGSSKPYEVFATEPKTEVAEVYCWEERYLGLQFHPELMPNNPQIHNFVEFLEQWVRGNESIRQKVAVPEKVAVKNSFIEQEGLAEQLSEKKSIKFTMPKYYDED